MSHAQSIFNLCIKWTRNEFVKWNLGWVTHQGRGSSGEIQLVQPGSVLAAVGSFFPLLCGLVIGLFIFLDFFSYSSVAITADTSFHSPTWKSKANKLFLAHKMSSLNVLTLEE